MIGTEFDTKEFTHQKFANINIGMNKLEVNKVLGKTEFINYKWGDKNYVDGEFTLVDTIHFCTIYGRDNHKTLTWRQYRLFYDKNEKLIGKHYRWFDE